MKKERYDDKLLTQYLLGRLPEQEAERLDEWSLTDDEMAARLQVVENDLVDAYVRGELASQTLERFDSYYLSSANRREKVAFARGLQSLIDQSVVTKQPEQRQLALREASVVETPAPVKSSPHRFFLASPALKWGLAGALLLIIAAGVWLVFENRRLRDQMSQSQAEREQLQKREHELQTQLQQQRSSGSEREHEIEDLRDRNARLEQQTIERQGVESQPPEAAREPNVAAFVLPPQTRGIGGIVDIPISADTDYVTMQLELEPSDFTTYRAELKAVPAGQVVWESRKLRPRARGEGKIVVLTVRAALLKSQVYQMELYGISSAGASEPVSRYAFRVVK